MIEKRVGPLSWGGGRFSQRTLNDIPMISDGELRRILHGKADAVSTASINKQPEGSVHGERANFGGLVLGCIDSYDSESRRIFSDFSRSTRFSPLRTALDPKFQQKLAKISSYFYRNFAKFAKFRSNFAKFQRNFAGISLKFHRIC